MTASTNHQKASLTQTNAEVRLPVFSVRAETEDGISLDLLVAAETSGEATSMWREHFALEAHQAPNTCNRMPELFASSRGPIPWA